MVSNGFEDFDREAIAPNFLAFLKKKGIVTFGKGVESQTRLSFLWSGEFHKGQAKTVLLDGKQIGYLELYQNPPGVVFEGEIPPPLPKKRGIGKNIGETGIRVSLFYAGEHPLAKRPGRHDGWTIPFP